MYFNVVHAWTVFQTPDSPQPCTSALMVEFQTRPVMLFMLVYKLCPWTHPLRLSTGFKLIVRAGWSNAVCLKRGCVVWEKVYNAISVIFDF